MPEITQLDHLLISHEAEALIISATMSTQNSQVTQLLVVRCLTGAKKPNHRCLSGAKKPRKRHAANSYV